MDIRPILSTLRRHKTASALIVLEIALTCAIICNALFLISTRLERMDRPSGLAETELVRLRYTGIGRNENSQALTREDLAALRAIPGVRAATVTDQIPFGNSASYGSINLEPDQETPTLDASLYRGDEQMLETFGLRLIAGRIFTADEYVDLEALQAPEAPAKLSSVILTQATAARLFPGDQAVGKSIYSWGDDPLRVVGVVEHLIAPNDLGGPANAGLSLVVPVRLPYTQGLYVLRTEPARRDEVLRAAAVTLNKINPNRILLDSDTFEQVRDNYYAQDRAMAWLLVAVCIALLVVTALGIVGLASFWVQQRTKQVGVRRALGATRSQILRYFQVENFILATIGIVIGMLLAYAINQLLMQRYELPRLPLHYLPIGAVALWLLGQVAVLGPARRAAAVPPAVATRSV